MAENYYYSSLSGDEIESKLVGAVVWNADLGLTTSQKAQARQNIGAGESDTKVIIEGFFDTLSDLEANIPIGTVGDVYAVGTQSPYDIYIWDDINDVWKNNGPLSFSDAVIDDDDISQTSTWSSSKISSDISGKQDKIMVSGLLMGNGSGGVRRAQPGTDYMTRQQNYSPVSPSLGPMRYDIVSGDMGCTLRKILVSRGTPTTVYLTREVSEALPVGAEIGIFNDFNSTVMINTESGILTAVSGKIGDGQFGYNSTASHTFQITEPFSLVVLKKMGHNDIYAGVDQWLITGNVEVVS